MKIETGDAPLLPPPPRPSKPSSAANVPAHAEAHPLEPPPKQPKEEDELAKKLAARRQKSGEE